MRGADNATWHAWYDGSWNAWQSLGGAIVSSPAAVSWGPNRIDLFGVGTNGDVYHQWYTGSAWSGWKDEIGAPSPGIAAGSSPAVSSWSAGRLDVFVRGTDNATWHAWWDGSWNAWQSLGGAIVSSPAAVSWNAGRIDLSGVGTDGNLWRRYFN